MAALGGYSNMVNMSMPSNMPNMPPNMSSNMPSNMPPNMTNNMPPNMSSNIMPPNMSSNMPPMNTNMMGGGSMGNKSGGFVTLRLIISREEGQYLFGADEALLGKSTHSTLLTVFDFTMFAV